MAQNKITAVTGLIIAGITYSVIWPSLALFMPDIKTTHFFVPAAVATALCAVILGLAALGQINTVVPQTKMRDSDGNVGGIRSIAALHEIDSVVFLASLTGFLWVTNIPTHPDLAEAFFSSTLAFSMAILIYFFNNDAVLGEVGKPERIKHLATTVRTLANGLTSASLVFAFGFFYLGILLSVLPNLRPPLLGITVLIMLPVVLEGLFVIKEITQLATGTQPSKAKR